MDSARSYAAVDLGASSGRVLLGRWDGERFGLTEMYRFPNGPVETLGELHWDVLSMWSEIKTGLARCGAASGEPGGLAGVGVDTWGVDYALLDRDGRLLGDPYHYRDSRTDGILEYAYAVMPRDDATRSSWDSTAARAWAIPSPWAFAAPRTSSKRR